jgi:hypothetical protein
MRALILRAVDLCLHDSCAALLQTHVPNPLGFGTSSLRSRSPPNEAAISGSSQCGGALRPHDRSWHV